MSLTSPPLEPKTTWYIDPDGDSSSSLRVLYTIPADGWSQWIGATKSADDGHVGVSVTVVTNLVVHGCQDHSPADPPVGPSVTDLATALADLAPFRVTSTPSDVTIYGYSGMHMVLTAPAKPLEGPEDGTPFAGCDDNDLMSWLAPNLSYAFYGYSGPDHIEEFWILDVEGSRLVIQANRSADSPPQDVAEMRAILDSIRIEP